MRVLVGHGWYDMRSIATWNFDRAPWRDFPRMIARLDIVYEDGEKESIVSDGSWKHVNSPIKYDCFMEGEVYDGREETEMDLFAAEVDGPAGVLEARSLPGSKIIRELESQEINDCGDGTYVVKFPENIAGWIRLTLEGQMPGDVVVIRYDERVNPDMTPAESSMQNGLTAGASASGRETRQIDLLFHYTGSHRFCTVGAEMQTDRLICSGGIEAYEPRFSFKGFHYVVLKGLRNPPKSIIACVVHTDFKNISKFESSDETLNMLLTMADRSYKANFANGFPTDCPHREKNGWTGDASIASELAQYMFENTAGYEKYLQDICDTQIESGDLSCIAPSCGWGFKWGMDRHGILRYQ